ncbi:MFS transporter [Maritimibacter sp. DP1N21-5]|uniref:MFS transporter n=1 Tax=Maritimibacter sp. DP1N21-5 TaxID=2836867 RepID=UPI001C46F8A8|nr:MFS transporter [Maritimibacter sp. DP1N21-5]MBV7410283.1 MFS transporter [Maritimibacter sp. DP1N21-5]
MGDSTGGVTEEAAFETLAGEPRDLAEARNGLKHMAALTLTKLGDGLMDPKLVLSWLLNALGAPAVFVSSLVPLREAGSLLPQILLARRLDAMRHRRWMWVAGGVGQGIAVAAMALAALTLEGVAVGLAFVAAIIVFALSRAAASVSYKDVLGKTVAKTRRGAVTGFAGSASAVGVLIFAGLLMSGWLEGQGPLVAALGLASCLWFAASALFSTLKEDASEPSEPAETQSPWRILKTDSTFARFVTARGFLTATALTPPYFVLLAGQGEERGLGALGALVVASAAASLVSSYVWGRLSDRSSRLVLVASGGIGALAMISAILSALSGMASTWWVMPGLLFLLMIAHHGVRQGRSTFLVDIAPEDQRAAYAATANALIGGLLLVSGAFGGALSFLGPQAALAGFAAMAIIGAAVAYGLEEAETN